MTDTSGEINLQSKQNIICHVKKVKPATSAHYVADVIPFLVYIIFSSNPTLRQSQKIVFHTQQRKSNHPDIYLQVSCLQAVLVDSLMSVDTRSTDQSSCSTTTDNDYIRFVYPL